MTGRQVFPTLLLVVAWSLCAPSASAQSPTRVDVSFAFVGSDLTVDLDVPKEQREIAERLLKLLQARDWWKCWDYQVVPPEPPGAGGPVDPSKPARIQFVLELPEGGVVPQLKAVLTQGKKVLTTPIPMNLANEIAAAGPGGRLPNSATWKGKVESAVRAYLKLDSDTLDADQEQANAPVLMRNLKELVPVVEGKFAVRANGPQGTRVVLPLPWSSFMHLRASQFVIECKCQQSSPFIYSDAVPAAVPYPPAGPARFPALAVEHTQWLEVKGGQPDRIANHLSALPNTTYLRVKLVRWIEPPDANDPPADEARVTDNR